jgi:hypothetical protein
MGEAFRLPTQIARTFGRVKPLVAAPANILPVLLEQQKFHLPVTSWAKRADVSLILQFVFALGAYTSPFFLGSLAVIGVNVEQRPWFLAPWAVSSEAKTPVPLPAVIANEFLAVIEVTISKGPFLPTPWAEAHLEIVVAILAQS